MKLNSISNLPKLKELNSIDRKIKIAKVGFSQLDLIVYTSNLCYYYTRIINNEIKLKDRTVTLNKLDKELYKLYKLLSNDDYFHQSSYTKKEMKQFYKDMKINANHLKTK